MIKNLFKFNVYRIERENIMTALLPNVDPDGLLEFSVVFTDRSLNHMSTDFQTVMCDISKMLTSVYNTDTCLLYTSPSPRDRG